MVNKAINRFDVQVVFPDVKFGIKSRRDLVLTPEDVAVALVAFIGRIRAAAAEQQAQASAS